MTVSENESEGTLWVDWYEQEDIDEIKQHRIFEKIPGTDYYITTKYDAQVSYKLYYVAEGAVNHGGSKSLPELPLTIPQYFQVLNACYFAFNIRYHLHKPAFYTDPCGTVPGLQDFEDVFGKITLPKL